MNGVWSEFAEEEYIMEKYNMNGVIPNEEV